MRSCAWILTISLLAILVLSAHAADGEDQWRPHQEEPGDWVVPVCNRVLGTDAVTFTADEGLTLAMTQRLTGSVYTPGLVTLDVGNTLLASHRTSTETSILRSEDAGCRWTQVAQLPAGAFRLLAAGPGDMAYGWSRGRDTFYRIVGDDVVALPAPEYIYGLAVDPADAAHIRIGTYDCQLYESFDGGASFALLGGPANSGATSFYTVEFDPANFDHALCGAKGAYRTEDAGQSWSTIAPFDFADADIVFLFEFSPADPGRVWARANLDTVADRSTEILVSSDGGATFVSAIVEGTQAYDQDGIARTVMLANQLTMAAHPDEPDVLYFTFPTTSCCPPETEGANLGRYDAYFDDLDVVYIDGLDGIDALAFNPVDGDVIYLGLESQDIYEPIPED